MNKEVRILIAEDDPQMQIALRATLGRAYEQIEMVSDGKAAIDALDREGYELIISDQRMPEMSGTELLSVVQKREDAPPFIMITAHGTVTQAVEAMQLGAADFLAKPFAAEDLLRVVERVLSPESKEFRAKAGKQKRGRPIITNDPLLIRILEVCEAVARSDATVLVQGESGTGKELIARLIHSASARANQPFVAVNCAALPATLLESELFGHEKGAFTGAQQRKIGKFELAHGGTILLDEISEMDLLLQAKLLRVLQEREVDRVGGRDPISIDVRVVATTNRNLDESVRRGEFRADLFYRLNVIPITLPPLRDRRGDIRLLVEHFMRQFLGANAPVLNEEVLEALEVYHWPGNVRELQNAVERAGILARGAMPRPSDFMLAKEVAGQPVATQELPRSLSSGGFQIEVSRDEAAKDPAVETLRIKAGMTVGDMERALIFETLRATKNNRTEAAKMLGISIRTLRNKLHEYRADERGVGDESDEVSQG